jgi:diguanylate cyclase (GGDEF)-like protein
VELTLALGGSLAVVLAAAASPVLERLRARTHRHGNLLEAVQDGVYILDSDLRLTHVNEEAERLLQRTADTLVGVPIHAVTDPLASELLPEIYVARRSGVAIERVHAFPDQARWVQVRIMPAFGETLISLQDVSAQTIAESQLHENANSRQLVANNADAVLWTVGRDGRFTSVSGGGLGALAPDDLVGQPCSVLVGQTIVNDVFAGQDVRVERTIGDRWWRHHIEPQTDANGTVVGAAGVSIDITELKSTQRQLSEAAHADRLTGLPNRFSLEQRLVDAVTAAQSDGRRFAILYLDLDRFKAINDTMGHRAGDDVLRVVAERLQGCVRGADYIARAGGDEFVILTPGSANPNDIQRLSDRLIDALAAPIQLAERAVCVGASIGAAIFPDHGLDAEAIVARADTAMHHAKVAGGGRLAVYEASMLAEATERFALESDLRHAIDRGQFGLEFQPLVSLPGRQLVGCEALVRWRHPQRGMIPPATFIPIAEDSFQVVEIDRWVLGEACRAAAAFRSIAPDFRLAVNLSARDLRDEELCARVAATLSEHGFPAQLLTMEITETAALDDKALPALQRLRELGVQLAMDDFGIGYGSLAHLKSLPITMIKIDRTFVRDIGVDASDRAIIVSMVNVAKAFGLRVVAEGIETDAQAEFVGALGCDEGQGFRFGAPQSSAALESLLRAEHRPRLRIVRRTA